MSFGEKLHHLKLVVKSCESAVVAFSGGVDSSVVCAVAREVLGDKAVAVTATSPTYPREELELARKTAKQIGIKQVVINTNELDDPNFVGNPPDRCYYCKSELFGKLDGFRRELGFKCILDGTNCDDMLDHRPGIRAAAELGVINPLAVAGMSKTDVRRTAVAYGLPNADKPANPCLASRIPHGHEITPEKLERIAKAEEFLRSLGFRVLRARDHKDSVRVEVGRDELPRAFELREKIAGHLKRLGYRSVTIDPEGYRTGGANIIKP